MKVSECNLKKASCCKLADNCVEIAKIMKRKKERHVIVCDKKKPLGVISIIDIINKVVAMGKDAKKVKAKDIMNKPVYHIDSEKTVFDAYFFLAKKNLVSCPVVDKGDVIGVITMQELMTSIHTLRSKAQANA